MLRGLLWRYGLAGTNYRELVTVVWEGPLWEPSWRSPLPNHRALRPKGWIASGQKTTKEGAQPYPSADNWIKALLSKALATRARPSFSHHQFLPSGSLHKPLSSLCQRAERRSKKTHSPTVTRTKPHYKKLISRKKQNVCFRWRDNVEPQKNN